MGHILANTLSKMPRTLYSILLFIANWLVAIVYILTCLEDPVHVGKSDVECVCVCSADVHRIGQPVAVPQFLPITPVPALRFVNSLIMH